MSSHGSSPNKEEQRIKALIDLLVANGHTIYYMTNTDDGPILEMGNSIVIETMKESKIEMNDMNSFEDKLKTIVKDTKQNKDVKQTTIDKSVPKMPCKMQTKSWKSAGKGRGGSREYLQTLINWLKHHRGVKLRETEPDNWPSEILPSWFEIKRISVLKTWEQHVAIRWILEGLQINPDTHYEGYNKGIKEEAVDNRDDVIESLKKLLSQLEINDISEIKEISILKTMTKLETTADIINSLNLQLVISKKYEQRHGDVKTLAMTLMKNWTFEDTDKGEKTKDKTEENIAREEETKTEKNAATQNGFRNAYFKQSYNEEKRKVNQKKPKQNSNKEGDIEHLLLKLEGITEDRNNEGSDIMETLWMKRNQIANKEVISLNILERLSVLYKTFHGKLKRNVYKLLTFLKGKPFFKSNSEINNHQEKKKSNINKEKEKEPMLPNGFIEIPTQLVHLLPPRSVQLVILGTGACLYGGVCQAVLKDQRKFKQFRTTAHLYFVKEFSNLPTHIQVNTEATFSAEQPRYTIGVGESVHEVTIESVEEWKSFLMTKESLLAYSDSDIEVLLLAHMLGRQINVVTFDQASLRKDRAMTKDFPPEHPHGWNKAEYKPDGSLSPLTEFSDQVKLGPIWILNERNHHWNLVVKRPSEI